MKYNKEEILNLLVEKISGYISVEDDAEVERVIHENEEIRALWQQMLEKHASGGKKFIDNLDEKLAWNNFKEKVINRTDKNIHSFKYKKWLSVAAIFVLMVSFSYYVFRFQQAENSEHTLTAVTDKDLIELKLADGRSIQLDDNGYVDMGVVKLNMANGKLDYQSSNTSLEWNIISVPFKRDYKLILSDGTEVWLNSLSNLRFPFNFIGEKREVFLEGEAYFKVAKDTKPFIVHVGETDIKVLGTSFNINSDGTQVITSLVEGSVLNSAGNESVLLKPGYQSIFEPLTGFKEQAFDAERVLSWREGIYYFEDVPLEDVSDVLWRWFKVKLIIDNPRIDHLTFTGAIEKNKPINHFMQNLEITSGIKTFLKDEELHLK